MADSESRPEPAGVAQRTARGNAVVCALLAWLLPGAGHVYLRRWGRGLLFLALVLAAMSIGVGLEGKLWRIVPGQPLSYLGTFACVGLGIPYFVLRFLLGYDGNVLSQGYEYGAAFLLTAGLMNLLLILDAWDLAKGLKE